MKTRFHADSRATRARALTCSLAFAGALAAPWFALAAPAAADPATPEALYALGQRYLKGDGVPRDDAKTFELMQKAAQQGHAGALATLGYCYSVGAGVAKDDAAARRYFTEAAEKGSPSAQGNLGLFLIRGRGGEKDVARGIEWMRRGAAGGNQQSAVLLGEIFYFGQHADGTPDFAKAHEMLIGPAEAGNAVSQNTIGVMHKDGHLGQKDEDIARVWFEKSAMQGNGKACFNLAELWNHQSSDRMARIEALRWLMVGSAVNEVMAYYFLEDIRANVPPAEWKTAEQLAAITVKALPPRAPAQPNPGGTRSVVSQTPADRAKAK